MSTNTHDGKVILTGKETWDAWIQSMSEKYLGKYGPTCTQLREEPREPQYSDFSTSATEYSQLKQTQQRSYVAVFRQWETRKRDYTRQEVEVNAAYDTILETVSAKLKEPLDRQALYGNGCNC